jgi:hypothetical protein
MSANRRQIILGGMFNDADIVIEFGLLASGVNLLPQRSTANGSNLCDRVCSVC